MILSVGDIHLTFRSDSNAGRLIKLSLTLALRPPLAHKLPVQRKFLDAMITGLHHIDIPF